MQNSNARYDVLSHWLSANENNPDKLSLQRIEAQANVNVGAGSEPVSCNKLLALSLLSANSIISRDSELSLSYNPTS